MAELLVKLTPPGILAILYSIAWFARREEWVPDVSLRIPLPGIALIVAGAIFIAWAAIQFRRFRTTIIPAGRPTALLDRGPYRISRNPICTADLAVTLGIAMLLGNVIYYAIPLVLWLILRFAYIPTEEAKMRRLFGEPFEAYCQRVRRWL